MQTQLSVDTSQLVNTFRHAFTKRSNVLGELMQNSRRAKATKIAFTRDGQNLTIEDDGCGIDNFSELLTVASSGWDLETMNKESPFGLGFLAAIYSCEHIRIESNLKSIECDTKDLLALNVVEIGESSRSVGTKITLVSIDYPMETFDEDISTLVQGFPIPVFLNGEELFRPYSIDGSLDFESTEIGDIHIKGIHDDTFRIHSNTRVYLQGLPIHYNGDSRNHHRHLKLFSINLGFNSFNTKDTNIIHLDSTQYVARVPDRDVLIDPDGLETQLKQVVLASLKACLLKEKDYYTDDLFVERRWSTVFKVSGASDLKSLFNDVDAIPECYFSAVKDYPVILREDESNDFLHTIEDIKSTDSFSEEELFKSNQIVLVLDELSEGSPELAMAYMFAKCCDKVMVMTSDDAHDIDNEHWFFSHFESGDEAEDIFDYEVVGSVKNAHFDTGVYVNKVHVEFCDHIVITHKPTNTSVKCFEAMVLPNDEDGNIYTVAHPLNDLSTQILSQLYRWSDEGHWLDNEKEYDEDLYHLFLQSETDEDAAFLIKTLLEKSYVRLYPLLLNTNFQLSINDEGEVDVKQS